MSSLVRPALTLLWFFTLALGLVYPAAVTAMAQLLFPVQANGSLIRLEGQTVGSALIGQGFSDPGRFWGRPSATSPFPYNAAASAGSNLGPSNRVLLDSARARVAALRAADPGNPLPVPVDLATASGSGLDPHISPAAALYQVGRVARARGLPEPVMRRLVAEHIETGPPGFLGEPRVNVLRLNLAVERASRGEGQY